jgi:hypothetical protein
MKLNSPMNIIFCDCGNDYLSYERYEHMFTPRHLIFHGMLLCLYELYWEDL